MRISVIIPTARDSAAVAPLLESLRVQRIEEPFEILLINDRPEIERKDHFCTVLRGEGRGPARARNLGAARARGQYLLFLDDDVTIDPDYLSRILKEIEARPNHAISGEQVAADCENSFSLAAEWMLRIFVEESRGRFAPSCPLALRRADFERVAGFQESFPLAAAEDREFCARWLASGFKIATLKEAAVCHRFPATFGSLVRQQWRYGRGAFQLRRRAPENTPSMDFYFRMLAEPLRCHRFSKGLRVSVLSFVSQIVLAAAYLRERIRSAPIAPADEKQACAE